jgi:hypothetical protein
MMQREADHKKTRWEFIKRLCKFEFSSFFLFGYSPLGPSSRLPQMLPQPPRRIVREQISDALPIGSASSSRTNRRIVLRGIPVASLSSLVVIYRSIPLCSFLPKSQDTNMLFLVFDEIRLPLASQAIRLPLS